MFERNVPWFRRCSRALSAVVACLLIGAGSACANPGVGANLGLRASVREDAWSGDFAVPELLRARVDFWKDIFTKYGSGHSVIHHRDFPQVVFGVVDLSREYEVMSRTAFEAYKGEVIKRAVDDVRSQLLELGEGGDARTPFQERTLEQLAARGLSREVLKTWVEQDLIRTQTGIRERYAEAIRRAWRYLPVMEQIFVQEFGLPRELTRIPFIESSFDYTAYSSVGAAGIWQFMPRTARSHRMLVGRFVDERRDPMKATRAAAEYLRSAYNSLGSWPLAVTSYNHGVGGVRSKARKAGTDDLAQIIEDPNERFFGFASTNFYPEFLAAVEIFEQHRRYFPEVPEQAPLRVVSYPLQRSTSAISLASRLGMSTDDLREANYGLLDPVWSGRASIPSGYTLRVPIAFKERADRLFGGGGSAFDSSSSRVNADFVKAGAAINARDSAEPQLVVSRYSSSSAPTKKNSKKAAPKQPTVRYVVVRPGDTLATIAGKRGVSIERLKAANGMRNNKLVAGQRLRVP